MPKSYYEFKDKTSSKFWEIDTKGSTVTVRYGKIGTDGQVTVKKLGSPAASWLLKEARYSFFFSA